MATFIDYTRVNYGVTDDRKYPLSKLYFCRHCLTLRSNDCVSHEVDIHYCPNCLENLQSGEAHMKKNRCTTCFDCPSCRHTLSTRATTSGVSNMPGPEGDNENVGKGTPKKVYYLACAYCRWTSRDVGMLDQTVASGGWQEKENRNTQQLSSLMEYYRYLAQQEKSQREKKKLIKRKNMYIMSDKYGLSGISARKRASLGMAGLSLKDKNVKAPEIQPSQAVEEVEGLPEDIFTKPVQLTQVTNMDQRLADPEFQPELVQDLFPRHKHLMAKLCKRCRQCEHTLCKPEYNPATIKFKIHLFAINHVPEIRIRTIPVFKAENVASVILTVNNPLDITTNLSFMLADEVPSDCAKVELPQSKIVVPARDDTVEFDDSYDEKRDFKDDPHVVVFRRANKVAFFIKVTPLSADQYKSVKVCFDMEYDYENISLITNQGETKEAQALRLKQRIYLDLGQVE